MPCHYGVQTKANHSVSILCACVCTLLLLGTFTLVVFIKSRPVKAKNGFSSFLIVMFGACGV